MGMDENANMFVNLDHIAIRCENLEKSIKFYTEILGFTVDSQKDLRPKYPLKLVNISKNGVVIELSSGHNIDLYSTEGLINHIGISVADIYTAFEYLKKNNVKLVNHEPVLVSDFMYYFFLDGPSGEKIEIVQRIY